MKVNYEQKYKFLVEYITKLTKKDLVNQDIAKKSMLEAILEAQKFELEEPELSPEELEEQEHQKEVQRQTDLRDFAQKNRKV